MDKPPYPDPDKIPYAIVEKLLEDYIDQEGTSQGVYYVMVCITHILGKRTKVVREQIRNANENQ